MGRILCGECVDLESVILDRSRRLRGLPLGVSNLELEIGIGRENPGLRVEFEFELHTGGRVVGVVRVFRIVGVIHLLLLLLLPRLPYQIRLKILLSKEISLFFFFFLLSIFLFSCFSSNGWLVGKIRGWWRTSEFLLS